MGFQPATLHPAPPYEPQFLPDLSLVVNTDGATVFPQIFLLQLTLTELKLCIYGYMDTLVAI